jgi:autotransporter-associated beta strand protein
MYPLIRASAPFLLAASGLSAQTVITLNGAGGNVIDATNYNLTSFSTTFGQGFGVEYLVVGGGGGGGGSGADTTSWGSGGGGAGGFLTGSLILDASSYNVTVGTGGTAGPRNSNISLQSGGDGGSSSFGSVTALGGGGGGAFKIQGRSGGSGGGGGGRGNGNNLRTSGGTGTNGQGFAGGASRDDDSSGRTAGGGGGGAGGAGFNGGTDASIGGNGGIGLSSSITGSTLLYAAGGGGGAWDSNSGASETAGTGGSGIGGNGSTSGDASSGAVNTGSGGGGVGTQGVGGAGGSGIVIARYLGSAVATGGTIAAGTGDASGYTVHTFTTTGASALNLSGLDRSTLGTTLSGQFTGTGHLFFNTTSGGASRFTLTGDSSAHTGDVIVNNGATVVVGDGATSGRLGTGKVFLQQGGTLVFDRSDNLTVANLLQTSAAPVTNGGTLVKRGAGTLTLTGTGTGSTHAGLVKVEQGSVVLDGTTRQGSLLVRAEVADGTTFNLVDNGTSSYGGYSYMQLETSGAGQFVFSGTNLRALSVAVPGNQWLSHTSSLAHTGGTVVDGAGLMVQSLAAGSDLTIRGGGKLFYHSGAPAASLGNVLLESGSMNVGTLSATSLEVRSGQLQAILGSSTSLLKTGSGTVSFYNKSGTPSSAVRVEEGLLRLISYQSSLGTGTLTVAGGALEVMTPAATASLASLVLDGGELRNATGYSTQLNVSALDLRSGTVSLALVGAGTMTKTTAGTVVLTQANAKFSGSVTVSDGTLQLGTVTSLGTASVLLEGGTIQLAGTTRVGYFEQTGGTVTGGTLISSQILTESGTLAAVIADDGGLASGILKRTAGLTQVTAANTFTGVVSVQNGTLQLDGAGAFASAARLATRQGGTLDLNGKSQAFDAIEGDGAIALGTGGALTVSSASSSTFDGVISGDGNLVKSGAGTLTLTGAASHTGGTSVTGGTLVVNGTLGSGTLAVAAGTTLGGSGTIGGATVISGIHSPGNSPGIQTFQTSLTYASSSQVLWELAGQTDFEEDRGVFFDGINVAGNLAFTGPVNVLLSFNLDGSTVNWTDAFWLSGHTWKLFDVGGSITGFENLSIVAASAFDSQGQSLATVRDGAGFSLSLRSGDVYIDYVVPAPIPEPSTYGLAFGLLALASVAVRRRAQRNRSTE